MLSVTFTETFEDAEQFAAFSVALKDFCNEFYSGSPRRKRAATPPVIPPTVPPAPLAGSSEEMSAARFVQGLKNNLSSDLDTVPDPQVAIAADVPAGAPVAAVALGEATEPAKPKRHRRTKAEIAADNARLEAERNGTAQPDLPKPHGGSNSGTTAPLPDVPAIPASGSFALPEGEITGEHLQHAWATTLMIEGVEPEVLGLLATHGISRARDAKPEQFRALVEGLVRIMRAHGK